MRKLATISMMCLVTFLGCQALEPIETDISIMPDITGSNEHTEIDISTEDILEIFDLHNSPFNHGKLRISTLTETHLSKIKQVKISPVLSMNTYNKYSRESEVNRFSKGVDSLLNEVKHLQKGKQASSLFIPISKELHRLASHSQAQNRILIVYSDLFENSSTMFSAYSKKEFSKILQNPEKLTEILNQKAPLPQDLSGIKIYLIYNPVLETDSSYLAISRWYKQLLENNGAVVTIGANLVLN